MTDVIVFVCDVCGEAMPRSESSARTNIYRWCSRCEEYVPTHRVGSPPSPVVKIRCVECLREGRAHDFWQGDSDAGYACPRCGTDESGLEIERGETT